MSKELIIHKFHDCGVRKTRKRMCKYRGVTIRIVMVNKMASVQYSYCSRKDDFCRKTGREMATASQPTMTTLKDLPKVIHQIVDGRYKPEYQNPDCDDYSVNYRQLYNFIIRNMDNERTFKVYSMAQDTKMVK